MSAFARRFDFASFVCSIEVVREGKYSPLELLLESKTTPDAIKDLAEKCCQRGPSLRPNFEQISGMITAAIPEGIEPRCWQVT
jgi:hypothetical protein